MESEKRGKKPVFRLFQNGAAKNSPEVENHTEEVKLSARAEEAPQNEAGSWASPQTERCEAVPEAAGQKKTGQEHSPEDAMQAEANYLEAFRCGKEPEELGADHIAYYSDFMLNENEAGQGEKTFLQELQHTARNVLAARRESMEEAAEPVNAHICIKIPKGKMKAWIFAFPPENGGKEMSEDLVFNALNECNIVYGLDEATINRIVYQKVYLKLAEVAHGLEPVDGVEGKVVDHFPRIERSSFEEIENSELQDIDFSNLDWLHSVSAGAVICDLSFPVEGKDGYRVTGEKVEGRRLEKMIIPNGSNTLVNRERTALVSRINGTLYYENGIFHVKDILNILSDVDQMVGDVDTIGNLNIRGDVMGGYRVQATGNIEIQGMVGNSRIIAGGNVKIGMGIRGSGEASIECGGDLDCVYIENCMVKCHGAINATSIINSDVMSDDEIESRKIVGGTVSALNRITAKTIGNNQHRPVTFNLGIMQKTLTDRKNLERREKELETEISQTTKNIRFLRNKRNLGSVDKTTLGELQDKQKLMDDELKEVKESLGLIVETINEFKQCELVAQMVYPPVNVTIRSDAIAINREQSMCRVWSDEGEIRMS